MEDNNLIPAQVIGNQMDVVSEQNYDSYEQAIVAYQAAKARLFDVNNWHKTCESTATLFQLVDVDGVEVDTIRQGHMIRIDIPGPGTIAGDGYDWVKIEQIEEQTLSHHNEWAGIRVRPCPHPLCPEKGTAHFFSSDASSTFMVKRNGKEVTGEVHGRNEVVNDALRGVFDGLRNVMVGYSAKIGFSYPQWKLLVDGFVKKHNQMS